MRPYFISAGLVAAGCCLVPLITGCGSGGAGAQASPATAIAVPGVAKLEASALASGKQVDGEVSVISCQSAGNCTAAGTYGGSGLGNSDTSVFVVSEKGGAWSTATTVAGATTAGALSCASAGNCVLGGMNSSTEEGFSSAYLAVEADGIWGAAKTIPSHLATNEEGLVTTEDLIPFAVEALSCTAPGDCTMSGQAQEGDPIGGYSDVPMVATVSNGVLGSTTTLPLPSFHAPGDSNDDAGWITSMSCASAGNCTATGLDEQVVPGLLEPSDVAIFAVSETDGSWSTPALLPGPAAREVSNLTPGQVSCGSAGNCGYVGIYADSAGYAHPFVASQVSGTWQGAAGVHGDPGYAMKPDANPAAISCPAPGACTAVVGLEDASQGAHAFAVSETRSRWGTATEAAGAAGQVVIAVVSCASPGNCVAAGSDSAGAITVAQVNGAWQAPRPVIGIAALEATTGTAASTAGTTTSGGPGAFASAISCVPDGYCGIGGSFTIPGNRGTDPFVVQGT